MWRCVLLVGILAAGTQAPRPAPIRWGGRLGKRFVLASTDSLDRVATPQQLTVKESFGRVGNTFHNEILQFTTNQDSTISCDDNGMRWCLEAKGTERGQVVRLNHCTGRPTQKWTWLPWGHIQLKGTNQCVHVNENGGLTRAWVELIECANKATDTWTLDHTTPSLPRSYLRRLPLPLLFVGVAVVAAALSLRYWLWRWQEEARLVVGLVVAPLNKDGGGIGLAEPMGVPMGDVPLAAGQDRRGYNDLRCRPRYFDTSKIPMTLSSTKNHSNSAADLQPLVVALDLDECLVHSSFSGVMETGYAGYDHLKVKTRCGKKAIVLKRKNLDRFLKACCAKYKTYIFTAGDQGYAEPVLDKLDPRRQLAGRLYRNDCTNLRNAYPLAKDVGKVAERCGRPGDFKRIVLVDNSIENFALQPRNGVPVPGFLPPHQEDNADHDVLMGVLDTLNDLSDNHEDVRHRLHELYEVETNDNVARIRRQNFLNEDHIAFTITGYLFRLGGCDLFTTQGITDDGRPRYRNMASDVVAWDPGLAKWTVRDFDDQLLYSHEQDSTIPPESGWTVEGGHGQIALKHNAEGGRLAADAHLERGGVTVSEIRVRSGACIDQISFVYSDGSIRAWGCKGGVERDAFALHNGEYITKVTQRVGDVMDMVQFFTSMGRESPAYGNPGVGRHESEFVASAGKQIIKLHRFFGYLQGISHVTEAPAAVKSRGELAEGHLQVNVQVS